MKIPAEFAPKSWEMPPGFVVLEESASVVTREFNGEKLDWLVALIQSNRSERSFTWARPLDNSFDAGFIALGVLFDFVDINRDIEEDDSRAYFNLSWEKCSLIRCFFINKEGALRTDDDLSQRSVGLAHNGFAAWNALATKKERITNFKWSPHTRGFDKFLKLQASDLWARLQTSLIDSESDASFSYRFMKMKDEERHRLVFNRSVAEAEEFYPLIYARLQMADFWNDLPSYGHINFFTGRYDLEFANSIHWHEARERKRVDISEPLSSDLAKLQNWFYPLNEEVAASICIQKWLKRFYPQLLVKVHRPTAHEQLEAALRWREWKAKHEKL